MHTVLFSLENITKRRRCWQCLIRWSNLYNCFVWLQVVCYIYFTRIIVYLLKVKFQIDLKYILGQLVFFVTKLKFLFLHHQYLNVMNQSHSGYSDYVSKARNFASLHIICFSSPGCINWKIKWEYSLILLI